MSNNSIKILLMEDNPGDRRLIQEMLAEEPAVPYNFKYAERLSTGLEAVAREESDVIMLDLGLPDSQGINTLKRVQTQFPEKPIVVLTGINDKELSLQAMSEGAQDYLVKGSINCDALWRIICHSIERKHAEKALRESEERYSILFENMLNGFAYCRMLFDGDQPQDFIYLNVNDSFEKLTGLKNIVGKKVSEVIPGLKESSPELFETYARVALTGQSERLEFYIPQMDIWLDISIYSQESGYFIAIFDNITDRKQMEEKLKQNVERLSKTMGTMIQAMALISEMRDPYTAGHQRRVTHLADTIAEEMGISEDQRLALHMSGLVHDLGKIYVPVEILTKTGQLTQIEFSIIKEHPTAGYSILKTIEFPWPIAEIVLQHHERLDGSGYPNGLSGEAITLETRILVVADVVEAMASHRPYRPALGIDKALEEISQGRGILYDPEVVDACTGLFTQKGFKLE